HRSRPYGPGAKPPQHLAVEARGCPLRASFLVYQVGALSWPGARDGSRFVILREAFETADIFHSSEDLEHFGQEVLVNRLARPLGPVTNIVGVSTAGDGGGDLRIGEAKLEGELSNVDAAFGTMVGGFARGGFDIFRLFEPGWQGSAGEEPRAEGPSVHNAHAFGLEVQDGLFGEPSILESVLVVAENAVHLRLVADETEN